MQSEEYSIIEQAARIEEQLQLGSIHKNAYYDKLTELIIKKTARPDSVCIDVGCHEGSILRVMMRYAPEGTFLAFEPLPHLYHKLLENFKADNVHIYDCALSNTDGASSFNYVITNPGYSGLVKRRYDRPHEDDETIQVQTRTLDSILIAEKVPPVSFMKVDVEGAEALVFEGALRRLEQDKPVIVFEHGMGGSDCYGKGPEHIYNLLCVRCGLRISLLSEWLAGKEPLDLAAFSEQFYNCSNYYFVAHV